MASSELAELGGEGDIPYECAYNFPAILYSFGSEKWPKLLETYVKLIKLNDRRVKIAIAASLHELAKILGPKVTE
jgi:hypothetical protein